MEIFGIKFAPLNVPLERRLQTLAAAAWFFTFTLGGAVCMISTLLLVLYTNLRWIILPYMAWAYLLDRHSPEAGTRIVPWVRSWRWWRYFKDYFPFKLIVPEGVELDPNRNYLFGCFPHGIMPTAVFNLFVSSYGDFNKHFPHHTTYLATLQEQFIAPFYRELILSLGGVASSSRSIECMLSRPRGGTALALTVGGAKESYNCKPGTYKIVLKNRKGFVKLALRSGASLVPTFSFGETDLHDQFDGPRLRRFQEGIRRWTKVAPIVPIGRGFFQYSFGLIPRRCPVTIVFGKPIDLPKIETPSQEEIDEYHSIFTKKLTELFEQYKHKCLEDPEHKNLIIE